MRVSLPQLGCQRVMAPTVYSTPVAEELPWISMAEGELGTLLAEARRVLQVGALGLLRVCSELIWPSWARWSIQLAVTVGQQPSPTVEQACLLPV